MKIAVAREIKRHEYRVGLTPACVKSYVNHGHKVVVETGAGEGAGYSDREYQQAGARISRNKRRMFADAEMIVKVKEPLPEEYDLFHPGQILYTRILHEKHEIKLEGHLGTAVVLVEIKNAQTTRRSPRWLHKIMPANGIKINRKRQREWPPNEVSV